MRYSRSLKKKKAKNVQQIDGADHGSAELITVFKGKYNFNKIVNSAQINKIIHSNKA
jgi:hypothetical protein